MITFQFGIYSGKDARFDYIVISSGARNLDLIASLAMTGLCPSTLRLGAFAGDIPIPILRSLRSLRLNFLRPKARDIAVVHRPLGDDADLDTIAERIVTVGRIGVGLMPGD